MYPTQQYRDELCYGGVVCCHVFAKLIKGKDIGWQDTGKRHKKRMLVRHPYELYNYHFYNPTFNPRCLNLNSSKASPFCTDTFI